MPCELRFKQKQNRVNDSEQCLKLFNHNKPEFSHRCRNSIEIHLSRLVTITWMQSVYILGGTWNNFRTEVTVYRYYYLWHKWKKWENCMKWAFVTVVNTDQILDRFLYSEHKRMPAKHKFHYMNGMKKDRYYTDYIIIIKKIVQRYVLNLKRISRPTIYILTYYILIM